MFECRSSAARDLKPLIIELELIRAIGYTWARTAQV